jgi:hypothetical protein
MRVVPALDAGPIILQAEVPILEDETYGELVVRLSELGALTLVEALTLISIGEGKETPQDDSRATYAPKLTRESARINWHDSAIEISRLIRASDPKPGAFTKTPKGDVKMFGPKVMDGIKGKPGEVLKTTGELVIACGIDAFGKAVQPAVILQRIARRQQPPHPIEFQALDRKQADGAMRRVRRVERAAEQPDAHAVGMEGNGLRGRLQWHQPVTACMGWRSQPRLPGAVDAIFEARQWLGTNRAAGVEFAGGNADLRTEAELATIGELRRCVVQHDRGIDLGEEFPGCPGVLGHDRIGVV